MKKLIGFSADQNFVNTMNRVASQFEIDGEPVALSYILRLLCAGLLGMNDDLLKYLSKVNVNRCAEFLDS